MMYPMNIFSPDPVSNSVRPFIIFVAFKLEHDVTKSFGYGATIDLKSPQGGFVLPFPNNGLTDSSSNSYGEESSMAGNLVKAGQGALDGAASSFLKVDNFMAKSGNLPDPRTTQVYNGTSSRTFTGDWIMIPQSLGEAALVGLILAWIKYSAAPERSMDKKIAILKPPHVYKIIFSNPLLHLALQYDQMAIESYSINYFAQGYASTYSDMMPKMISLSMTFKEYGIKVKEDWSV